MVKLREVPFDVNIFIEEETRKSTRPLDTRTTENVLLHSTINYQ